MLCEGRQPNSSLVASTEKFYVLFHPLTITTSFGSTEGISQVVAGKVCEEGLTSQRRCEALCKGLPAPQAIPDASVLHCCAVKTCVSVPRGSWKHVFKPQPHSAHSVFCHLNLGFYLLYLRWWQRYFQRKKKVHCFISSEWLRFGFGFLSCIKSYWL